MRQFATGCAALPIFTISGQPIAVIEIHSPAMRLAELVRNGNQSLRRALVPSLLLFP
jgi:hypothetical protein